MGFGFGYLKFWNLFDFYNLEFVFSFNKKFVYFVLFGICVFLLNNM